MNKTAVMIPSVTLAMKAKRLLVSRGFKCEIKRASNVSKNGCTHYITVNSAPENVLSILDRNNIKHGEILSGEVEP
ncbi:MAG: putative Se/S carrier-like protein [Porcipelethomonas sp.]